MVSQCRQRLYELSKMLKTKVHQIRRWCKLVQLIKQQPTIHNVSSKITSQKREVFFKRLANTHGIREDG